MCQEARVFCFFPPLWCPLVPWRSKWKPDLILKRNCKIIVTCEQISGQFWCIKSQQNQVKMGKYIYRIFVNIFFLVYNSDSLIKSWFRPENCLLVVAYSPCYSKVRQLTWTRAAAPCCQGTDTPAGGLWSTVSPWWALLETFSSQRSFCYLD